MALPGDSRAMRSTGLEVGFPLVVRSSRPADPMTYALNLSEHTGHVNRA